MTTIRDNLKRAWETRNIHGNVNLSRIIDKLRFRHHYTSEDCRQAVEQATGQAVGLQEWDERMYELDMLENQG